MSTYGIAGLVDGFIQGRNVRNSWEDRKENKERQKRLDDLTFKQDDRAAEEHSRRMKVFDQNASDWDRSREDSDAYRKAQNDAVNAALGIGEAEDPATMSTSGPPAPRPVQEPLGVTDDPVAGVAANLGIDMRAVPNRTTQAFETMLPMSGFGDQVVQKPAAGPTVEAAAKLGPSFEQAGRGSAPAAAEGQPQPAPNEPRYIRAPQPSPAISDELWRQGAIGARDIPNPNYKEPEQVEQPSMFRRALDTAAGVVTDAYTPNGEIKRKLPADYSHDFGVSLGADASEMGKRSLAAGVNIGDQIGGAYDSFTSGAEGIADYVTGTKSKERAATPNEMTLDKALEQLSEHHKKATTPLPLGADPELGPRMSKAVPASAPPEVKQAATAASGAMSEVAAASPAVAAAASSASKNGLGVDGKDLHKPEARDRAAASFMDRYREVGAPMVMEEMLRRGDFEKAQKFQEFLDQGETKAGMDNWAKAAFAATVGDMDGFADNIVEAFNRMDYFPDGTTIVKEKSGFSYGKDGEILGAKLTFRDEASGNTFEQVYSSPEDLIKMGISLLAPENAFEYYVKKDEAERAARAAAQPDPREVAKTQAKRIDDMAKVIFESTVDELGTPKLTYAEAREEAARLVEGKQPIDSVGVDVGQAGAPPPVAYRP